MNAWGIVVILLGAGLLYWAVKQSGTIGSDVSGLLDVAAAAAAARSLTPIGTGGTAGDSADSSGSSSESDTGGDTAEIPPVEIP